MATFGQKKKRGEERKKEGKKMVKLMGNGRRIIG